MEKENKETKESKLTLTFFTGRDKKVIAKAPNGKICLIDIKFCIDNHLYINEGELWECRIKEEREKYYIIQPLTRLLDEKENYETKLKRLKNKYCS